jgi:hypothetical protein
LPFVVAFYARAGIEVVRYFGRALFFLVVQFPLA